MSSCPNDEYYGPDRRTQCIHAEDAAEKAVRKTFAILGVDVNRPEQVKEFQESLRFGEFMRKTANKGVVAGVTILTGAILTATWYGIKTLFLTK